MSVQDRMNLTISARTSGVVDLPLESIHSGDQLAIFRRE